MPKKYYRHKIALGQKIGLYGLALLATSSAALVATTDNRLLSAPAPVAAQPHQVALLLQPECGQVYRVERSLDNRKWAAVGTRRAGGDALPAAGSKHCDDTFQDAVTSIPRGAKTVYYRYEEIADGKSIRKSAVGTFDVRRWQTEHAGRP